MPRNPRRYDLERKYDGQPEVKARRAARNRARYQLKKEGLVQKGDGKDVDHKRPLSKGGGNGRGNLRAVDANKNRSYKRTKNAKIK
jgi:hypothetical protein